MNTFINTFDEKSKTRTQLFNNHNNQLSWRDHGEVCLKWIERHLIEKRNVDHYQGINLATLGLARCLPRSFFNMHGQTQSQDFFYMSLHKGGRINSTDQHRNQGFFFLVGLVGIILRLDSMNRSDQHFFLCSLLDSFLTFKNSLGRKELILPIMALYGFDLNLSDEEYEKISSSKNDFFIHFKRDLEQVQTQCDLTISQRKKVIQDLVTYLKTQVPTHLISKLEIFVNAQSNFQTVLDIRRLLSSTNDTDVQTGVELTKHLVSCRVLGPGISIGPTVPLLVAPTLHWLLFMISQKRKIKQNPKWKFTTSINKIRNQNKFRKNTKRKQSSHDTPDSNEESSKKTKTKESPSNESVPDETTLNKTSMENIMDYETETETEDEDEEDHETDDKNIVNDETMNEVEDKTENEMVDLLTTKGLFRVLISTNRDRICCTLCRHQTELESGNGVSTNVIHAWIRQEYHDQLQTRVPTRQNLHYYLITLTKENVLGTNKFGNDRWYYLHSLENLIKQFQIKKTTKQSCLLFGNE